jgi:hypothetical protein
LSRGKRGDLTANAEFAKRGGEYKPQINADERRWGNRMGKIFAEMGEMNRLQREN